MLRVVVTLLRQFWLPRHFNDHIIHRKLFWPGGCAAIFYPFLSDTDCTSGQPGGLPLLSLLRSRSHHEIPAIEDSRRLSRIGSLSPSQGFDHGV